MSIRERGKTRGHKETLGPSQRQLRVGEELRHTLVEILRENNARDPELQDVNVTVTQVSVSPDLRNATAFVMTLGGEKAAETVAALNRASPYFRAQMAKSVKLRFAPAVTFEIDTSFEYAERIETLLRDPEIARNIDLEPDIDAGPGSDPEPA